MKARDITGDKFGRLTALYMAPPREGRTYWVFQCECGSSKEIRASGVVRGTVRSCGCLHIERCKSGLNPLRHGDARNGKVTRLHKIWRGMLNRCNPANPKPHAYALRGIGVCQEWQQFEPFKAWAASSGYADDLTIDRIDNDGNYEPMNCRWANRVDQARNRRTSKIIEFQGRSQVLAAWAVETGLSAGVILHRLRRGWSMDKTLTQPAGPQTGRPKRIAS